MLESLVVTITILAFGFLALSFFDKTTWGLALLATLLFVSAGYIGTNIERQYCEREAGNWECTTQSLFNYEMPILMGAFAMLSAVVLALRMFEKDNPASTKEVPDDEAV